jgi:hypothetical protein
MSTRPAFNIKGDLHKQSENFLDSYHIYIYIYTYVCVCVCVLVFPLHPTRKHGMYERLNTRFQLLQLAFKVRPAGLIYGLYVM